MAVVAMADSLRFDHPRSLGPSLPYILELTAPPTRRRRAAHDWSTATAGDTANVIIQVEQPSYVYVSAPRKTGAHGVGRQPTIS